MTKKPILVDIEEAGFVLDEKLKGWLKAKFPTVDSDETYELFVDKALAKGWVYANWSAAFRNYVRNGNNYGGVAYKSGLSDPAFASLIQHAQAIGFRHPRPHETPGSYRTELQKFDRQSAGNRFGNVIKRFGP